MWRGGVAILAVLAAAWLPFYLADPGTMSRRALHHPQYAHLRPAHSRGHRRRGPRPGTGQAQVLLGWALGAVAVWRRRWPAVILLGVGARIALDPGVHGYYTAGVMVGALIWDTIGARRPWPVWVAALRSSR